MRSGRKDSFVFEGYSQTYPQLLWNKFKTLVL